MLLVNAKKKEKKEKKSVHSPFNWVTFIWPLKFQFPPSFLAQSTTACAPNLQRETEVNEISHLWSNKCIDVAQRDALTFNMLVLVFAA